jgi:hypothetical protein
VYQVGHSFVVYVTLSQGPHEELVVTPTVNDTNSGLVFEPSTLTFGSGETQKEWMIFATQETKYTRFDVDFILSGTDVGAYNPAASQSIEIVIRDPDPPSIERITYAATRTSATFTAYNTRDIGIIYYLVELKGFL